MTSMMLTRRKMIGRLALGAAGMAGGPWRLLAHNDDPHLPAAGSSPILAPFQNALPIPPVLQPVRRGKTQFYTLTMRAGLAKLHRDLPSTVIWGFNGLYPGPTIRARKGEPVVVRQINHLPEDLAHGAHGAGQVDPSVHLHGAHVAPGDDGHPRESIPRGGFRDYHYPNQQRGTTLFYHDHSHGKTGLNVYRGLAGTYLIDDPEEDLLALPKGDFDVPLMIQDRILGADGSLIYMLDSDTRETGMLGDCLLVNGVVQPFFKVAARKYRFRIVNASNARIYQLQLSSGQPLIQIGTDGGLLPKPIAKSMIEIAPAERIEVVVDFSVYPPGTKVVLRNCMACTSRVAEVMRFDVESASPDPSLLPDCLSAWEELPTGLTVTRQFILNRQTVNNETAWVINGQIFDVNNPPLAQVKHGTVERWRFVNPTNHPHPVHIHLVQFQVIEINGVLQDPSRHGWKDTLVAPPGGQIVVAARFDGYTGKYLFHCHNLEHEDLGMMADYEIVP